MSIQSFYNKTVSTKRLVKNAEGYRQELTENLASVRCTIRPAGERFSQVGEGRFFKTFVMYCDIQDILYGDWVIDGEDSYAVVGVDVNDYGVTGSNHLRVLLEKSSE